MGVGTVIDPVVFYSLIREMGKSSEKKIYGYSED
jgi:hypothetical protein